MKSLSRITKFLAIAVVAALAFAVPLPPKDKFAGPLPVAGGIDFVQPSYASVTSNAPLGANVLVLPFHITGAVSSTATVAKFNMPMPCQLIGVEATSRAISGTNNTVDVALGGVSVLSAPMTIGVAGTIYGGAIATSAITDEGVITIVITINGTSLTDTTVLLTCVRR